MNDRNRRERKRKKMIFDDPRAFFFLPLLAFFISTLAIKGWRTNKEIAEIFQLSLKIQRKNLIEKYLIALFLMVLLVLALASPKIPCISSKDPTRSAEIALVVDISLSMGAQKDLSSPTRMERTKSILHEIVNQMEKIKGVKISLHGFSNISRSHVPTVGIEDYPYLRESIDKVLEIHSVAGSGTSFVRPIINVIEKMSPEEEVKLIIIFSDGETSLISESTFLDATNKAINENIRIVTVGVGELEGARIPIYNLEGIIISEYAKDARGFDHISYLQENVLREIATQTEGRYFNEEDQAGLIRYIESIFSEIPSKSNVEFKDYRSVEHWFIFGSLVVWVIFIRYYLL